MRFSLSIVYLLSIFEFSPELLLNWIFINNLSLCHNKFILAVFNQPFFFKKLFSNMVSSNFQKILLLLGCFSALRSRSARFSHFSLTDSQSRRKLQNLSLIGQIEGVRLINCALKCLRHASCVSFTHEQSLLCSLGGSSYDMTSGESYAMGSFDSLRDMHCFQGNFPFSPRKSFVFSLA